MNLLIIKQVVSLSVLTLQKHVVFSSYYFYELLEGDAPGIHKSKKGLSLCSNSHESYVNTLN